MKKKHPLFLMNFISLLLAAALLGGCSSPAAKTEAEPAAQAPREEQAAPAQTADPSGPAPEEEEPSAVSESFDLGVFTLIKTEEPAAGGTLRTRAYVFPDGSSIEWGRVSGNTEPLRVFEETLSSGHATYTRKTYWRDHELGEGSIPDGWIFVDGDEEKGEESFLFLTPRFYRLRENGALQAIDSRDMSLDISATKNGLALTMDCMRSPADCCSDYMVMRSPSRITEFDDDGLNFWMPFDNKGVWRWAFDGYYFQADPSYIPSGEGVYTNLPSCYVAGSLEAGLGRYDCAAKLLLCLLHTMTEQACDEGFLESRAVSGWLSSDYGMDGAYYDTRFNSDFAEHCIKLYNETGAAFLTEYLDRYMDFYLGFAASDGWSPEGSEGLFVPDYWMEKEHKTPHTALNHQLAEMSVLYKLSALLGRTELAALSDRLLLAIEDTAPRWIMKDDNLEYAILTDGSFGFTDYPNLTYNDLFDMQRLFEGQGRERSGALDLLMEHKKLWMDRNGVKGYRQ